MLWAIFSLSFCFAKRVTVCSQEELLDREKCICETDCSCMNEIQTSCEIFDSENKCEMPYLGQVFEAFRPLLAILAVEVCFVENGPETEQLEYLYPIDSGNFGCVKEELCDENQKYFCSESEPDWKAAACRAFNQDNCECQTNSHNCEVVCQTKSYFICNARTAPTEEQTARF